MTYPEIGDRYRLLFLGHTTSTIYTVVNVGLSANICPFYSSAPFQEIALLEHNENTKTWEYIKHLMNPLKYTLLPRIELNEPDSV